MFENHNPTKAVKLLDGDDGSEIWAGTLKEFYDQNALCDEEMDEIEAKLASGEPWHCGGGAAAAFTLIAE